jgi:hypothetical protein
LDFNQKARWEIGAAQPVSSISKCPKLVGLQDDIESFDDVSKATPPDASSAAT